MALSESAAASLEAVRTWDCEELALSAADPNVEVTPIVHAVKVGSEGPRPVPRRWPFVVLSVWVALHLLWVLRALYPGSESLPRRLPWNMFSTPRTTTTEIRAEGRSAAGVAVEIPLHELYRFARGATEQRVYATSRFLLTPGHRGERRAFAEWLAAAMEGRGEPLVEIVLVRRDRWIVDGRVRRSVIGRFPVSAGTDRG